VTLRSLLLLILLLGAGLYFAPEVLPQRVDVRMIDEAGTDAPCPPSFAYIEQPNRNPLTPLAMLHDFAYAAAAAGPLGSLVLLGLVALLPLVLGLWFRGFRCALRRLLLTFALGIPLLVGLMYTSCLIEGRTIRLGPAAVNLYVPASLHTQTNRGTGLLSPLQLVRWHFQRDFRVLNVSDRNDNRPGLEAKEAAMAEGFAPTLLVLAGEEWHAAPDLVLVHTRQSWGPRKLGIEAVLDGVRGQGGASFVAHPWSKMTTYSLKDVIDAGVDGLEVINGVIHGGSHIIEKARKYERALLGVSDYKFGPHVNALTLLPKRLGRSPRGVVTALRERQTRVLYAVPGGTRTPAEYEAVTRALVDAVAGLRSLFETPSARRATWLAWLAGFLILWWVAARSPRRGPGSDRLWRTVFLLCCVIEFALPFALSWQAREVLGPVSVPVILTAAAIVAVPLLVATRALSFAERHAS